MLGAARRILHISATVLLTILISVLSVGLSSAADEERVMLILDASGSMWGQVDKKPKYEIARSVIGDVLSDIGDKVNMGVMAYGHRTKGDCKDIQTLIPIGPVNRDRYMSAIGKIKPKGKTPISAAVRKAAEALKFTEEKATIVLVSDGLETCKADPCALASELEKLGIDFTVHVVGFDLGNEDTSTLSCLAKNTGGLFLSAENANELSEAIGQVVEAVRVAFAEGARFLVEDNHLQASGDTTEPDGGPGNAFQWGSDELIIRYNVIERGGSADQQTTSIGGLMGATSTSFGQPYVATDSRIYNNTVVKNRGLALGLFDFGVQPVDLGRNRYVNNMFYGSNSAATGSLLAVYWDTDFATGDRFVGNVWGNPGGSTTTPIVQNAHQGQDDLATAVTDWRNPQDPELAPWHGFPNFYSADPGFVDYAGDDFRLAESSSYRDAGAPLTRVAASDPGTGTDLELEDTRFLFAEAAAFPAWMGVQPEHIAIGPTWASATRIAVTAVDDEAGTVTLARSIDRQVGDFVWLWRDSTGRQVVSGAGPDIGALESVLTLFTDGFETGDTTGWTTTVPLP